VRRPHHRHRPRRRSIRQRRNGSLDIGKPGDVVIACCSTACPGCFPNVEWLFIGGSADRAKWVNAALAALDAYADDDDDVDERIPNDVCDSIRKVMVAAGSRSSSTLFVGFKAARALPLNFVQSN